MRKIFLVVFIVLSLIQCKKNDSNCDTCNVSNGQKVLVSIEGKLFTQTLYGKDDKHTFAYSNLKDFTPFQKVLDNVNLNTLTPIKFNEIAAIVLYYRPGLSKDIINISDKNIIGTMLYI